MHQWYLFSQINCFNPIMAPTLADFLKEPKGPLPTTMEALTQAEVVTPSVLPFAQASSDGEDVRNEFLKAVSGQYTEDCAQFFNTNNLPMTPTGQMVFTVTRFMKGESFIHHMLCYEIHSHYNIRYVYNLILQIDG